MWTNSANQAHKSLHFYSTEAAATANAVQRFICGMPPEPCALSSPALGYCNNWQRTLLYGSMAHIHITKPSLSCRSQRDR